MIPAVKSRTVHSEIISHGAFHNETDEELEEAGQSAVTSKCSEVKSDSGGRSLSPEAQAGLDKTGDDVPCFKIIANRFVDGGACRPCS